MDEAPKAPGANGKALAEEVRKDRLRQSLFGGQERHPRVGRYRIVGSLGRGGMGTVLEGYDEALDRRVAIKVLDSNTDDGHQQRLRREARALARLSIPNVVQVYEVDEIDGCPFIAMELLSGQTLRKWQATPRGWGECLSAYLQAGRGLATAHEQGLIHRDFKPSNCMIDDGGHVRVLDFGLAREIECGSEPTRLPVSDIPVEAGTTEREELDSALQPNDQLTKTGTVLGTLAYMPPEQLLGRHTDERSDQFSFCVALYEALYGVRPFQPRGVSAMSLLFAIQQHQLSDIDPRRPSVPSWLRRVVLRGLSCKPGERYPNMQALLDSLERIPRRRRRIRSGVSVLGLLALVGGGAAMAAVALSIEQPCREIHQTPLTAWTDERRRAVHMAMLGTDGGIGEPAWTQVSEQLDKYGAQWMDARAMTCEDTHVRRIAGDETFTRRMACLERASKRVDTLVDRLERADRGLVAHAPRLVQSLSTLADCLDMELLRQGAPPVPGHRAEFASEVRELIDRSWIAGTIGETGSGLELASNAVRRAEEAIDAPQLLVEALLNRGSLYRWARRLSEAKDDLRRSLELAEQANDDTSAIYATRELIEVTAYEGDRTAASVLLSSIRGKLQRAGNSKQHRASLLQLEGLVAITHGDPKKAAERYARSARLYRELESGDRRLLVRTLIGLGVSYRKLGNEDESYRVLSEARNIAARGQLLQALATITANIGHLHFRQGDFDRARVELERAIDIRRSLFGPHSAGSIRPRINLARIHQMQGEVELAERVADEADLSIDAHVSPMFRAELATLRASLFRQRNDYDTAITEYGVARSAWKQMRDYDPLELAMLDSNEGDCLLVLGRSEEARQLYLGSLLTLELHSAPDDPRWTYPLLGLGTVQLNAGEYDDAVSTLRRGVEIQKGVPSNPEMTGLLTMNLVQALAASNTQAAARCAEIESLLSVARRAFEGMGDFGKLDELSTLTNTNVSCRGTNKQRRQPKR